MKITIDLPQTKQHSNASDFLDKLSYIEAIIVEEIEPAVSIEQIKEGIIQLRDILNTTPEIVDELMDEDIGRMVRQAARCVENNLLAKAKPKARKKKAADGTKKNLAHKLEDVLF